MPIPAGVTTATVHHDAPVSFGGDPGRVMARFKPSVNLIWEATGTPLARFFDAVSPANGEPLEVELPHTDQPGFVDGSGNTVNNWHYSVKVVFFKDGQRIGLPARDFQLSSGQSNVDLALIPYGVAVNPTVAPLAYVTSVNGQTGDIEITSLQGPAGPTGATGPAGPTGPAGADGVDGVDGVDGATGPAGPQGPAGPAGADGADGADGAAGPEGPAGPIVPLDSLTDVTAPSPTDGQALVWDAGTSKWINGTVSGGGGGASALDDLTDVTTSSLTDGQALVWDATTSQWINVTVVGEPGPEGPAGPAGADGADGATGATGPAGPTGPAGADGATGATGATGPQGPAGQDASRSLPVIAKTANYTLTTSDDAVTFNGSSLTATIPDPTTCAAKVLRIKNLHATDLTVVSAGTSKTIDGAASLLITQYLVLTVVSDGTTWHIVAGRDSIPSSTFKPGIVDKTSGTNPTFQVYTNVSSTLPAVQFNAVDSYNRPGLRVAVSTGPNGPAIEAGTIISGTYYGKFAVDSGGKLSKLNGVDFTMSVSAANPQDQIASGVVGITTDTNPGLTYLKRATGNPWPAWNFQPYGYFGQPQTKTANYTVDFRDTMLIGNGSSITFTLPDPTASGLTAGRKFEFKNIHSTALTIVSAGSSKTIDGLAAFPVSQWASIEVATDGAQWLVTSSYRRPVSAVATQLVFGG
jgi:hypothetical protein